jgi:hypothetical protein
MMRTHKSSRATAKGPSCAPFEAQATAKGLPCATAQGTIEYLVIIGIVVVLSLVVVSLITSTSSGSSSTISSTSNKISQSTGSISITESVIDANGNGIIALRNNSGNDLTISKIVVEGKESNYSSNQPLLQGMNSIFTMSNLSPYCNCNGFEGQNKKCTVIIHANSEYGLDKTFQIETIINCVNTATPENPTRAINPLAPSVLLLSPADNNNWTSSTTVRFDYNVSTDANITNCNLLINDLNQATNVPINGIGYFNYLAPYDINYTWKITCTDSYSSTGTTNSRTIRVDANAYQINDCNQLQAVNNNLSGNYILMNDINCFDTKNWNSQAGFNPIGSYSASPFLGTFDGNYHTISNLRINRISQSYVALFSYVGTGGKVQNVGLIDSNVLGRGMVASLVAFLSGDVNKSFVNNPIVVSDPNAGGSANGVGGLVGQNGGTINNSYTLGGSVTGGWDYGGGVSVGNGITRNSYSTTTINMPHNQGIGGGIVSEVNTAQVYNCFAAGAVNTSSINAGAIAGRIWAWGVFSNVHWYDAIGDTATNCYYNGNTNCTKQTDLNWFYLKTNPPLSSWDFNNVWKENATTFPTLRGFS